MVVNCFICLQCVNNGLIGVFSFLKEIIFSGVDLLYLLNIVKYFVVLVVEMKNEKI